MAVLRNKECPSCGAPLPVPGGAGTVRCEYCGTTVEVQWTRAPPPPESRRPQTVYVRPGLPKAAVWGIVLTGLLPAAIPAFIFLGPSVKGVVAGRMQTFPITCGMNEELTLSGRTFSGTGTLVTAELNCKLHIVDSQLSGDIVVAGNLNTEITVENSTLTGKEAAIKMDMNGHLRAKSKSLIASPGTAIVGATNTHVELQDSRVEGGATGVEGDLNLQILAERSSIRGNDVAIRAQSNAHVHGKALTVKSEGTAVEAEGNLEIAVESTTFEGKVGVHTGDNARLKLTRKSRVTGKAVGVEAGRNLTLSIGDSTVEGQQVAVCGKSNGHVSGRGSTLSGAVALHFEREPDLSLTDTTVTGARAYDRGDCRAAPPALAEPAALPRGATPARRVRPVAGAGRPGAPPTARDPRRP